MEVLVAVIAAAVAGYFGYKLVSFVVESIVDFFSGKLKQNNRAKLSETDMRMVAETQELMRDYFGENIVQTFSDADNIVKMNYLAEFSKKLCGLYGLDDIGVDIVFLEGSLCGYYNYENKKAYFNVRKLVTCEVGSEEFNKEVYELLDTVAHELRHAVQRRAIEEDGFWQVDNERREKWAENLLPGHYIPFTVDARGYFRQPIENDAFTFAAAVMDGVKN